MKLKRLLALVLCLCMIVSAIPAVATAAETTWTTIEAENTEYAVWNRYSATESNGSYSGGKAASNGASGAYPYWDDPNSTKDLSANFLDKSAVPYVAYYVEAPADGTYSVKMAAKISPDSSTDKRLDDTGLYYGAFYVNGKSYLAPYANSSDYANQVNGKVLTTQEVQVELTKGINTIISIALTAEQQTSNSWTNMDCLMVDSRLVPVKAQAKTLYAGNAPYIYGYTTKNKDGNVGAGGWGNNTLPISSFSTSNVDKLRSITYTVNAPKDGYYDITAYYNSADAAADKYAIGLMVDGKAQAREFKHLNASGSTGNRINLSVYLTAGNHVMTITAPARRTADDPCGTANIAWFDYTKVVLYGGLTESAIQTDPQMQWWNVEAENQDYVVWHTYSTTENNDNAKRDYNGPNFSLYNVGTVIGGGNTAKNASLAQLQEGRLDKSTASGVTFYVEAPAAGKYTFKARYRLNNPDIWDSTNNTWKEYAYGVFMVNGDYGCQAFFNKNAGYNWTSNTHDVDLNLKEGLNEITFIPMTADQRKSGSAWVNMDYFMVDTDLQVVKIPTGSATYTPEQGTPNLFVKMDSDGTIGYDKHSAASRFKLTASNLTRDMLYAVPFMAYTVEAPYDGYYDISLAYKSDSTNGVTAQNHAIAVFVDDSNKAEVKHLAKNGSGTADVSTYLTAGKHTIVFTMAMPINETGSYVWCNLGNITMNGGLTLAAEQVNPLYSGMTVMEAETDAAINRHNPENRKQASAFASGGYEIGQASGSTQTVEQVKEHLDPSAQAYVEYLVEAEADEEYTLMLGVRGQFSVGNKLLLQVNGVVYEQECYFDDSVHVHIPVTVSLKKGVNTIRSLAATRETGWVNQDCLGLPAGLKAVANGGDTIEQADNAAYTGNYNYYENDGRFWDKDGLQDSIVSTVSLSELSLDNFLDTSWYSLTVEAPADGWYGVQNNVWLPTIETAQAGKLGVLANGTAYEAKLWQDSTGATRAEAFVYLNKGINDLIFTGLLADSNVAPYSNGDFWADGDYVVLTGGVKKAETQRYPVQGLIPGSAYTEENGVVTVPAGTSEAELKSNFYSNSTDGFQIVYDETKTVKSMGASQILALGNPVGRVMNYRNAVFMEASASGFTITGELEGDVTITLRAEKGKGKNADSAIFVEIDGVVSKHMVNTKGQYTLTIAKDLVKGNHTIQVTKAREAICDMIYVYSISYTGTVAESEAADMRIEYLGDSIAVGYGLYEPDVSKKNTMPGSYFSFANVAADILGADHYVMGNGGWRFGANTNGTEGNQIAYLGSIYEKNSMNLNLGNYDFAWQPDVIVINLGTNDANQHTFIGADAEGATAADIIAANQDIWSADIAALLAMVRKNNPNARILWAYGAMEDATVASKDVVVPLIRNAIDAYNAANSDAVEYVHVTNDNSGVYNHPSRDGHKVIGEEIATAIIGKFTTRMEVETDSIFWRYGLSGKGVGNVQPGTLANMQSYADLASGAALKKTEHPMVSFIVDVETEGDYVLDVAYQGNVKTGAASDYFMVVGVDDASYTKTSYVGAHPENSGWSLGQATVHLTAGRHTIRVITMVADTRSSDLFIEWINLDYVDVTGDDKVTVVAPEWTHLQSGETEYTNYFTTVDSIAPDTNGEWFTTTLGGYRGDTTAAGLTVDTITLHELSKLGYFSYTVEVPADGFYDLQTYIRCNGDNSKQRTGHIMLAVDDQINWYNAEFGYATLKWNAQNLSIYLTKGTHVLTVSGIIGDIGTCGKNWCDMGALSVSGGITLADEQIDPMTLIQNQIIYVDAVNGDDLASGAEDAPVKTLARALAIVAKDGTVSIVSDYALDKDVTAATLMVSADKALDLNGYALTATNLVVYGNIIDSSEGNTGKVVSQNALFLGEMEYMPIYDSANGCYKFYAFELKNLGIRKGANGSVTYGFAINFANADAYALLASGDCGVKVNMNLAWGENELPFTFDAALVQQYAALQVNYSALRAAMMLTVTGLDILESGDTLTVTPSVEASGLATTGTEMVYTVS